MKKTGQIRWDITSNYHFCIFGTFLHFWVVLGEPVSYKITRGVKLVVERVTEGVYGGFGADKGVKGPP